MFPERRGPRPVLLAGPTASGKSGLALRIAERDGGVVINADAAQVYDCWRVLTARPSEADDLRAPHRLYGHVFAGLSYSAGAWLRDVLPVLDAASREGLRPIVVGGTGLYFAALTQGLAHIPPVPPEVRAQSEAMRREATGLGAMLADLQVRDPETHSRIDARNPMRVQRAWDVLEATGRGLAWWQTRTEAPVLAAEAAVRIVLSPEIYILNNNITARIQKMIEAGALEECRRFARSGLNPALPAAKVIGAPQLTAALRGEITLEAAIAATALATRQFAKRQRTWFRNRMPDWPRLDPASDPLDAVPRA